MAGCEFKITSYGRPPSPIYHLALPMVHTPSGGAHQRQQNSSGSRLWSKGGSSLCAVLAMHSPSRYVRISTTERGKETVGTCPYAHAPDPQLFACRAKLAEMLAKLPDDLDAAVPTPSPLPSLQHIVHPVCGTTQRVAPKAPFVSDPAQK
jgi:hypothetical protein